MSKGAGAGAIGALSTSGMRVDAIEAIRRGPLRRSSPELPERRFARTFKAVFPRPSTLQLAELPNLIPRPAACDTPAAVKGWRPDPAATDVAGVIRRAGLRPTQQRLSLGKLLFASGDRHVSAEMLHAEAIRARMPVSLATVYNTLRQFTEAGLLRELTVDGARAYFDTNLGDHHHFFVEGEETLSDVPAGSLALDHLPEPPEGMEIVRVDVVVRLRRKRRR